MQVACVVNQWAKTSPFQADERGGLSFMTEAAITRNLNQWLADDTDEATLGFDLPVEKEVVKKVLSSMYTDQLHCGLRHGVQKSSHSNKATTWNIAFDLEQRGGLQSPSTLPWPPRPASLRLPIASPRAGGAAHSARSPPAYAPRNSPTTAAAESTCSWPYGA